MLTNEILEILVIVTSAILGLVSVFQTMSNGWKRDKDNYVNLREKYDKLQQEYYELKVASSDKDRRIEDLEQETAKIPQLQNELEYLRKRLDDTIRFGEATLDKISKEGYDRRNDKR